MASDQSTTSSRAAGLLSVQLGANLKLEWTKWCALRNQVPGSALRGLVERVIREGIELPSDHPRTSLRVDLGKHPDKGPKVSRELQFTPSENAAVEAAARGQGFGFQEWVIAAVRAALTKVPTYGQAELEALTQSNAHMATVAIELGALRRQAGGDESADAIANIEADVRRHVETVSTAMAQGARRWQLKV